MHLREDTSRTRTTMGITWLLLLSLSFLFHCVSSQATNSSSPSDIPKAESDNITKPTTVESKESTSVIINTSSGITTQASSGHQLSTATTAISITPSVTKQPTEAPSTTQTQASTITSSQLQIHHSTSATPPALTSGTTQPTITSPPSSMSTVAVKQQETYKPTELSTVTWTEGSSKQPTDPVVTSSNSNVFKTSLTTEHRPTTQTTTTASKITDKVEMTSETATTSMPTTTTTSAQEPSGNSGPGAISTTSALATTTSSTQGILTTEAKSTMPQETTFTAAITTSSTKPQLNIFQYSLKSKLEEKKEFVEVCKRLMANLEDGNCTLEWQNISSKVQFQNVEINGKVKATLANQHYEELTKKATDNKTLIAILASCGALLIMIIILAVCASHHRKPYNETQQHLTEELHTVENGYHDNPTLEVMEVQPEMQEKKLALNGEFNDSWIVPIDNLLKEDMPDEEDTHL